MRLSAVDAAREAGEPVKLCGGCLRWLTLDRFARRTDRRSGEGRASRCKDCVVSYNAAYRLLHPEKVGKVNPATRAAWHEKQAAKYRALAAARGAQQ